MRNAPTGAGLDTRALIAKSVTLQAATAAEIARSRELVGHIGELLCRYPFIWLIAGGSEQGTCDLTAVIQAKIARGTLPSTRPSQVWAGSGRGGLCNACDQPIPPTDIEYEADVDNGVFRFHRGCFDAWHQERAGQMAPPISGGSDMEDVASLLLYGGKGLCTECISAKTGIAPDNVGLLVGNLGSTVRVHRAYAVCFRCLHDTEVFSLV